MMAQFPTPARNDWGAARKALNLTLRDILYNQYLQEALGFNRIEKWLELPIDGFVAKAIRKGTESRLPVWRGIKHLTKQDSEDYQRAAREIAVRMSPIRLDILFFRNLGDDYFAFLKRSSSWRSV